MSQKADKLRNDANGWTRACFREKEHVLKGGKFGFNNYQNMIKLIIQYQDELEKLKENEKTN